jgi:hypothetical protein
MGFSLDTGGRGGDERANVMASWLMEKDPLSQAFFRVEPICGPHAQAFGYRVDDVYAPGLGGVHEFLLEKMREQVVLHFTVL